MKLRPNPDLLLAQIQKEEKRNMEGKLKIFFGSAPGVGKTYAMLKAARQKSLEGIDVVAGLIETHGRSETALLLEDMEIIKPSSIHYKGTTLLEFDIDAVLRRKPFIVLVDELAHTNAEGLRHKKRWQDVFELLSSGINVYTTVNVQHLESLNDVIAQITGIVVKETIPDSVIDRADEIEIIDIPPEELLLRLKEGKVYVDKLAEQARKSFFRKGNLLALRELTLRKTAQRVDEQMQTYRRIKGVKEIWPATDRIMVCVGANPRSIRLIRAAKRMADSLRADWIAVNVEAPTTVKPSKEDLKKLAQHIRLAESLGAETATLSGHKASEEILNYARARNITKLIVGKPTHPRWKDKIFGSLLDEIVRGSGNIDIYVITGEAGETVQNIEQKPILQRSKKRDWLFGLGSVIICTLFASLIFHNVTIVDIAMIYIVAIVITASFTNKATSILVSFLSIAAFDFFFVPPYFTFAVGDAKYILTFIVMFIVAFVISRLTLRVREQANAARSREKRTSALYKLSRELSRERKIEKLCAATIKNINDLFSSQAFIFLPDKNKSLMMPFESVTTFPFDARELSVAQWTFDHNKPSGIMTDTLPGSKALYIPLIASSRTVGVVGIIPGVSVDTFNHEQIIALEGFANQAAMAIERAIIAKEAHVAFIKAETEILRSTMLSSVSHDLRTPLAAITGAATTLLEKEIMLDELSRKELILTIFEEAEHLSHMIRNVLDMTRLESDAIKIKKEWQSIEEIIGVVLNRFTEKLKNRPLKINLPQNLPLIPFDPLLIEQVFMNLIDNAIKHTPDMTAIEISVIIEKKSAIIEVSDRGQGLPKGYEEKTFEKFVRGSASKGGIGLGLSICRSIIKAHGGNIWANNSSDGGAKFTFTLPVEGEPPIIEQEKT